MGRLKCPKEEYEYLQRLRDRLITAKIDLRKIEQARDAALRERRLEEAEREARFVRAYLSIVRDLESAIQEFEERCLA